MMAPVVDGLGYGNWTVVPDVGLRMGMQRTKGRFETAFVKLEAKWQTVSGTMQIKITAPIETKGSFKLGGMAKELSDAGAYDFKMKVPL